MRTNKKKKGWADGRSVIGLFYRCYHLCFRLLLLLLLAPVYGAGFVWDRDVYLIFVCMWKTRVGKAWSVSERGVRILDNN